MTKRRHEALEGPYIWTAVLLAGRQAGCVFWLDFRTLGIFIGRQAYVVMSMALAMLCLYGLAALASGRRAGYWFGLAMAATAVCISVYDGFALLECYRYPGCNAVRFMPMRPFIPVATLVSASILTWRSLAVAFTEERP